MRRDLFFIKRTCSKRLLFPLLGLASLVWFLIRVLPKPARAGYPCMRAAFPLASGFVLYALSLFLTIFSWKKVRQFAAHKKHHLALACLAVALLSGVWFLHNSESSFAETVKAADHKPNEPMGAGIGIHPGRVVWVYDPAATNEKCTGALVADGVVNDKDNLWFQPRNNDANIVSSMVSRSVLALAGVDSNALAWDALFRSFNQRKGKGAVGFSLGEKILIKTNATSSWGEPGRWGMYAADLGKTECWRPDIAETNPYVVLGLLRELVNKAGIPQEAIYVGDPMKQIYKEFYTLWRTEFPHVHYLGNDVLPHYASLNILALGRTPVAKSDTQSVFYSDHGQALSVQSDALYTILEQADYLINVPTLKAHGRAGITLSAKNHFGSHTRNDANHLHDGLVSLPGENDKPTRTGYGLYRVQVDFMQHKYLGGNTMLVLVDGLYPCDEAIAVPGKWKMAPFNGDWASSIFISQDQVAIESVCFDFLRTEYNGATLAESRPNWSGVDDYLHQAADSSQWPAGIRYDPDRDGQLWASAGVHEHWNDAVRKQYSRNLGKSEGIELVAEFAIASAVQEERPVAPESFTLRQNYPNPFNNRTTITYILPLSLDVNVHILNLQGRTIRILAKGHQTAGVHQVCWDGTDGKSHPVASGIYFYRLVVRDDFRILSTQTRQMLLIK